MGALLLSLVAPLVSAACADPASLPAPPAGQVWVAELLPTLAALSPPACLAVRVDLDGDTREDLAALARDPLLPDVDTVMLWLSAAEGDPAGGWRALVHVRALDGEPRAWAGLRAKPAGEAVTAEDLSAAERATLTRAAAVEVLGPAHPDAAGRPTAPDTADVAACSTWYTWGRKGRVTTRACTGAAAR